MREQVESIIKEFREGLSKSSSIPHKDVVDDYTLAYFLALDIIFLRKKVDFQEETLNVYRGHINALPN